MFYRCLVLHFPASDPRFLILSAHTGAFGVFHIAILHRTSTIPNADSHHGYEGTDMDEMNVMEDMEDTKDMKANAAGLQCTQAFSYGSAGALTASPQAFLCRQYLR